MVTAACHSTMELNPTSSHQGTGLTCGSLRLMDECCVRVEAKHDCREWPPERPSIFRVDSICRRCQDSRPLRESHGDRFAVMSALATVRGQ